MDNDAIISYCDPGSILIINRKGQIKRLYTPFKVICIEEVPGIKAGTTLYIDEVGAHPENMLVYITQTGAYSHRNFIITASF